MNHDTSNDCRMGRRLPGQTPDQPQVGIAFTAGLLGVEVDRATILRDAGGDHGYFGYLHADDVDALHREFVERGAIVLEAPDDRPYGMREMTLATPDGHRLVTGQPSGQPSR